MLLLSVCVLRLADYTNGCHCETVGVDAADLESLTQRACSPRRYDTFIAMLLAALRRASSSVSLDILSFSDLAGLRSGSSGHGGGSGGSMAGGGQPLAPNNKRYLILTHASEFERVQYPLPLCLEARADAAQQVGVSDNAHCRFF